MSKRMNWIFGSLMGTMIVLCLLEYLTGSTLRDLSLVLWSIFNVGILIFVENHFPYKK
jgi:hypothetical protein